MSPVGSAFRARCRMFPSLVNCCTIDWFTEWPGEALLGVATTFFKDVDLGADELRVGRLYFLFSFFFLFVREWLMKDEIQTQGRSAGFFSFLLGNCSQKMLQI